MSANRRNGELKKQSLYKSAYLAALKEHPFPLDLLCKLHSEPPSVVRGWLSNDIDNEPDFSAIYEIYVLLNRLNLPIPIQIQKLMNRSRNRVINVVRDMKLNPITNAPVEKNKRIRAHRATYYIGNEAVYFSDIKNKLNLDLANSTILARIRKAGKSVGDNIDDVDFTKLKEWKRKANRD